METKKGKRMIINDMPNNQTMNNARNTKLIDSLIGISNQE